MERKPTAHPSADVQPLRQSQSLIICICDPEEAAERDRRLKAELAARNNKPVPTDICRLGPCVWCDGTPHAGELSVQGVVEANGKRDRFDQAVGRGWMVIGFGADPSEALSGEQKAALRFLEGRTVEIGAPSTGCEVQDVEGTYARWLNEIDARYVVVRPDFYVAATANSPEDLRRRFDEVMDRLHLWLMEAAA